MLLEVSDDARSFLQLIISLESVDSDWFPAEKMTWFTCDLDEFGSLIPTDGLTCRAPRHGNVVPSAGYMDALIDEEEMCIHYWPTCWECHMKMLETYAIDKEME